MSSLRVAIVDDEPLARMGVRARLAAHHDVVVVGEAASCEDAVALMASRDVDLVFLDIRLGDGSGFSVLSRLAPERVPLVVFVTAHDDFAVQAFEAHALDYILKPPNDARMADTVARARASLRLRRSGELAQSVLATLEKLQRSLEKPPVAGPDQAHRVAIRTGQKTTFVRFEDIDWLSAEGDYVRVHAAGHSQLMRTTLGALETLLPASAFLRIHRSCIVNIARVQGIESGPDGWETVLLPGGSRHSLSRSYRARAVEVLGMKRA